MLKILDKNFYQKNFLTAISIAAFIIFLIFYSNILAAVSVTPAAGGLEISADTASGIFTNLTGPEIIEADSGEIGVGTIILNVPAGFEFLTAADSVTATKSDTDGNCTGSKSLQINNSNLQTVTPTASTITINVTRITSGTCIASISWSGIAVRPTAGTPLASGNIAVSGTSLLIGITETTNFGTLTEVPGVKNMLVFTVQPSVTATTSVDFLIKPAVAVSDQFGNSITDDNSTIINLVAKLSNESCAGIDGNGVLSSNPLSGSPVSNGILAYNAMSYSVTESIRICASSAGINSALSNQIIVSDVPDAISPIITSFSIPSIASSLEIPITSFTATDNAVISGYLITETSSIPLASDPDWSALAPSSFLFSSAGTRTAYAWAKDASGNISSSVSATITITLADTVASVAGGAAPSQAIFSGQAYPNSLIQVLRRFEIASEYEGASTVNSNINDDGTFEITMQYFPQADYLFGIQTKDKDGRDARFMAFSQFVSGGALLRIENIIIPPTIELKEILISRGRELFAFGYAAPRSKVEIYIDGSKQKEVKSESSGYFEAYIATDSLNIGDHFLKVRETLLDKRISDFSNSKAFKITLSIYPKTDLNSDGVVNILDWSIFLYRWGSSDDGLKNSIDFNIDKNVNIADFSIFLNSVRVK